MYKLMATDNNLIKAIPDLTNLFNMICSLHVNEVNENDIDEKNKSSIEAFINKCNDMVEFVGKCRSLASKLIVSNEPASHKFLHIDASISNHIISNQVISHVKNIQEDYRSSFKRSIMNDKMRHEGLKQISPKPSTITKTIKNIDSVDLGDNPLRIPVVDSLKDVKQPFYWYSGDAKNREGVYIALTDTLCCRINLPNVIPSNSIDFKYKSNTCRYGSAERCRVRRHELSKIHNSNMRDCNFTHYGERFNKLGTMYRCPNVESFGNHKTLNSDMTDVSINDIKHLLMNCLSDALLASIWAQNHYKSKDVMDDLDLYV